MPFLKQLFVEDVGEARRDDAAYAEIEERPGGVLALDPQPKFSAPTRILALR